MPDILEATSYETTFKNRIHKEIAKINTCQIQYPLKTLKLVAANNTHLKVIILFPELNQSTLLAQIYHSVILCGTSFDIIFSTQNYRWTHYQLYFFFLQFPLCDGSHNEHNKMTGDNVGPLIIKAKSEE